jgi:PAS domain S-box-containing protein
MDDIMNDKRAEEALRQSEECYRMLAESTTDIIYIANRSGDILYANRSAAACMHCDVNSIVGKRQDELFPPEMVREHMESIATVFQTGEVSKADGMYRFGSEEMWLNTRLIPLRDESGQVTAVMGVSHDVTDRKRAEAALKQAHDELEKRVEERTAELAKANESLRQSEEKYRGLVDICPDSIVVSDLTGKTLFVSKQTWKLLGVSEHEELVGRNTFNYVIEADRPRLAANYAELLQIGRRGHTEYTVLRADGTTVPVELSSAMIQDAQGRPIGALAIIRDISERKRAQEALRQSEEMYRGLVDICPDAIVVLDLTGKSLFVSKEMRKLLDVSEDKELVGKSMFDYVIEAERGWMATNLAELIQVGKHAHTEYTILRPNGTTVSTEISSAIIRDAQGRPTSLMAIVRDISERKRAQEAIRLSEEKYRSLIEVCPDSVVMSDLAGKSLFVSKQAWKLLGISEEVELVGQSIFNYVVEADRPRLATNLADLIKKGLHGHSEYTGLRPDGTTILTELSSAVIRDAEGQPTALVAIIRDISERKRAEVLLQQHYEELRAIYEGMADGLVILDVEANSCVRANRSMCELLGYSEEELKALPLAKLHPPEALPAVLRRRQALVEGRLLRTEDVSFLRKDGSVMYSDITSDRITYDGRPCLIHLVRDTTERRQAQEALKKEHRTLKHLLQSSDRERQLIAYEIHDGLAQQLAGAIMQIETCWHQKDAKPREAAKAYDAAITMLRQGHFEVRRLISGVRPPILDEAGIVAAVAHLVNEQELQNSLKIEFRSEVSFRRLTPILENAVYRIVQEGLANACKHSKSDKVRVELVQCDDVLRIKVQDWGVGFDPAAVRDDRFGLEGIRERARLLGGGMIIESTQGRGTSIAVELPLVLREN